MRLCCEPLLVVAKPIDSGLIWSFTGSFSSTRPWELSVIDNSILRVETKKWNDFNEEQWNRYEKEIRNPTRRLSDRAPVLEKYVCRLKQTIWGCC